MFVGGAQKGKGFSAMILYLSTLLKLLTFFAGCFLVDVLESLMYNISSANRDNYTSLFSICISLFSLLFITAPASAASTILKMKREHGHPCFTPNFNGSVLRFSSFGKGWLWVCDREPLC